TYLVRAGVESVIAASPDVNAVIGFDKYASERGTEGIRKKARELNELQCDTQFLLHASERSQRLSALLNCENKIGFEGMRHAGLTHFVPDTGWSSRYERAVLLLRAIAPRAELRSLPKIVPPANVEDRDFFERGHTVVALAPGSAWETKEWGTDKFLDLARSLIRKGIGVVVIGGEKERAIGEQILAECPEGSVLNLAGKVSFLTSITAMQASSLLVANDSAPVHAAVAVGTKVLAIYGPTVPAFGFAPPAGCGETVELADLWCRPCTPHGSHTCPIYTHACMRGIAVRAIVERIERMLSNDREWNGNATSQGMNPNRINAAFE
ncbi:MAG TPA: glycosyltransferase family 9 protein, partial [Candidatus Kapabacteria bacterium]